MKARASTEKASEDARRVSERESLQRRYVGRKALIYRILRPPIPVFHNPAEPALPQGGGLTLWIGAAGQIVPSGVIVVDIISLTGVDIVADVEALPFACQSVSRIECNAVLEHVQHPIKAVSEMFRVLKPEGYLHIVVPFCHPVHLYPADYSRWTIDGLRELVADFEIVDIGGTNWTDCNPAYGSARIPQVTRSQTAS